MPIALLALAIGAFGIGTTEFVMMGLLPETASDFDVPVATAGLLVTGYALGVMCGSPLMVALGTRITRKRMMLLLMVLFVAGNVLSALAPVFSVMLAGRVLASITHGAYLGIGSVVATELVGPERKAAAIATMFTGLTVANLVGVPLGTWLGQLAGWRATFLAVAGLGVLGLAGIARYVPELPRPEGVQLRHELSAFRNVQVLLAMATTVLGVGALFAAITYIAPMMTEVTGYAPTSVTWLLALLGIGMVAGNVAGGRYADRALMPMLCVSLGALALVLASVTLTAHSKPAAAISILLIGALGFATITPLQKRVVDQAAGAPTLASAVNIGAANFGIGIAAWLGGLAIAGGHGYTSPSWIGSAMATAALALSIVSRLLERRAAPHSRPGHRRLVADPRHPSHSPGSPTSSARSAKV